MLGDNRILYTSAYAQVCGTNVYTVWKKRILCDVGLRKAHKLTINENRTLKTIDGITGDTQFDLIKKSMYWG